MDYLVSLCNATHKEMISMGVLLDLSKAFDTMNHQPYHHGIRGLGLDWIKSYLSHRVQFTTFNNVDSERMNSGVLY